MIKTQIKQPPISIIVPVYKAEAYLHRCIDSILSQTYKDFELILVDDGSPDNCPKICDEYAKKDKRTKVIHKENGGVSSARNAGIDASTGDYLMFVDSDDYVTETYVSGLYDKLLKHPYADVAVGALTDSDDDPRYCARMEEDKEVSLKELKKDFDVYFGLSLLTMVPSKIYKRQLIGDDRFDTSFPIGEDYNFNLAYFSKCKSVLFTNNADYVYDKGNASSAMHNYNKDRFFCEKRVYCAAKLFRYGEIKCVGDACDQYFCQAGMRQVLDICSQDVPWKDKKKEMRAILDDDLYKAVVRGHYKDQSFKGKILHSLCKHRNYAFIQLAAFARGSRKKK